MIKDSTSALGAVLSFPISRIVEGSVRSYGA